MRIKSLTITNVKSFRETTHIEFDEYFNILIGPNAGGKSNLLDIITIVLRHFFIHGYRINEGRDQSQLLLRYIRQVQTFGEIDKYLEKFTGSDGVSNIDVVFKIGIQDIENIRRLKENKSRLSVALEQYAEWRQSNIEFLDSWDLTVLHGEQDLKYQIVNNRLQPPTSKSPENTFLEYLNHLEKFLILSRDLNDSIVRPIYLYFSPDRGTNVQNTQANLSAENYHEMLSNYFAATSRTTTVSAMKLATHYFALRRRLYEKDAADSGFAQKWREDDEVQLVSKYLDRLGYSWNLRLTDESKNIYDIELTKSGQRFEIRQASSGEKEIINFLLGIFAFNIRGGLVVVDEPDLHLHPQWQNVLVELFVELAKTTDSMFLLATHSPIFISEETISSVVRVYKDQRASSNVVTIDRARLTNAKDLLHIVRSHNNEKMFFADRIVLVEGIKDRLVFEKLVDTLRRQLNLTDIVETLEVSGKENLSKYRGFLDGFGVWNAIIADLDYVHVIGDDDIEKLLDVDFQSVGRDVLNDSKSRDGQALSAQLDEAIRSNNLEELRRLWEHIKARKRKLRADLNDEERKILDAFLEQQKEKRIFILKSGEIEDYLPDGYKDLTGVVEFVKDGNFEKWMKETRHTEPTKELLEICSDILGFTKQEKDA